MPSGTVTTIIATWGAILSTFVILRDLWRARSRARVKVAYSARVVPPDQQPFVVTGTIENHGRDPIHLAKAGIRGPRVTTISSMFVSAPPLPVEVKPGQSFTGDFRAEEVWTLAGSGEYREVQFVFFDQLGREFVSKATPVAEPKHVTNSWTVEPLPRPTLLTRLKAKLRGHLRLKPDA